MDFNLIYANISALSFLTLKIYLLLLLILLLLLPWVYHAVCAVLVPWTRIEPRPLAVKAWSPNHWTTRELLLCPFPSTSVHFSSATQSCLTLCDTMDCSIPDFLVHHQLPELAQTHVHQVRMPSNHLILCHSLLLLPSIFPSIRVFSNDSVLLIRWPKYWSFSFSISSSNEYSGLISFRMDLFDLLAVQGTLQSPF